MAMDGLSDLSSETRDSTAEAEEEYVKAKEQPRSARRRAQDAPILRKFIIIESDLNLTSE